MGRHLKKLFCILGAFISFSIYAQQIKSEENPVILLSIDGFSSSYLELYQPKNLLSLANQGLIAESLTPVFPSKTFPNHLSIVTGKYPSEHGIIANSFYRRDKKTTYRMGAGKDDPSWLTAEPIWITAEKKGKIAACYFWPESETTFDNLTPSYSYAYDGKVTNEARINQIIAWLKLPKNKRPHFITSYFSLVDSIGHEYGVNAKETAKSVKEIDDLIGYFIAELNKLDSKVNLIIVSDHGMIDLDATKVLETSALYGLNKVTHKVVSETQIYIYDSNELVIETLQHKLMGQAENRFSVYRNGEFPSHWHFNVINERVPDIIINANVPYSFSTSHSVPKATHGYDPLEVKEMAGIFISVGPNIKQGRVVAFENVHVHGFLLELLKLSEHDNHSEKKHILSPFILQ